ncbi:MAG: MerR family transcriptional regulator [Deltaproteobacteria bacterium]|nr:MerR family transcriptional regulator [Deltaproteobacteria bacterium]
MPIVFGRQMVMSILGLTRMQLSHWDKTGVVKPTVGATGKGTRRGYTFQDLVQLRVAKQLREDGVSLQKIRKSLAWLRKHYLKAKTPLAELRLVTDGETLFVVDLERDREKIIDTLKKGQTVFSVALGELIEGLQGEVKKLATPKDEKVEVDGHTFTVVLTPELEEGGFTVQCKEEPAALSQGKTEQEAIDNIIDALELCLEHEREFQVVHTTPPLTRPPCPVRPG